MSIIIKAKNINEAYIKTLIEFFRLDTEGHYSNAYITNIDSGSFGNTDKETGQKRLQTDLLVVEIEHPEARPLHLDIPSGIGMTAVNDATFISEYTNSKILNNIPDINETYTYGSRIFAYPDPKECTNRGEYFNDTYWIKDNIDQYSWVVNHFKNYPGNNHCCIQIAMGGDLELEHAPCLRSIDLKIVEGKMNMTLYFRSWDAYAGMPSNLAAFQSLNESIVESIGQGLKTGKLFGLSSGAHIYSSMWELAKLPYEYYILGNGR